MEKQRIDPDERRRGLSERCIIRSIRGQRTRECLILRSLETGRAERTLRQLYFSTSSRISGWMALPSKTARPRCHVGRGARATGRASRTTAHGSVVRAHRIKRLPGSGAAERSGNSDSIVRRRTKTPRVRDDAGYASSTRRSARWSHTALSHLSLWQTRLSSEEAAPDSSLRHFIQSS